MDHDRKKMIIQEILYWKENRMLPEQYCDYLLALYTEGNQPTQSSKTKRNHQTAISLLPLVLIPISVFFLYFTELSIDLQIGLSIIFMITGIIFVYYFSKKGMFYQVPLAVTAMILLLSTVELTTAIFPESAGILYAVLVVNCLLWLLAGWRLKLIYFSISGTLGLGLLIFSIFI